MKLVWESVYYKSFPHIDKCSENLVSFPVGKYVEKKPSALLEVKVLLMMWLNGCKFYRNILNVIKNVNGLLLSLVFDKLLLLQIENIPLQKCQWEIPSGLETQAKSLFLILALSNPDLILFQSMFEIISSEATYLKSLNVLINVFLMSPEFSSNMSDRCVITKEQRHILFSNIGAIRDASERFLADLEATWQKSVVLSDVCDIIAKHAIKNFECYVRYCSNQMYQDRAVSALRKEPDFSEALKRLEQNPDCQGLPMISFLLLPMQRITRLPLLVDAICHRLEQRTERHRSATNALQFINKLVRRCNEGAKRMQQTEQMCLIAKQLDFKVKEIPLISASRFLVKQGEVARIRNESSSRLPFGKGKPSKQNLYLFLFSDIMLITKKKSNTQYLVIDHAMRNALMVENIDNPEKSRYLPNGVPSGSKNLFLLVLLENVLKKPVEMVLTCASLSDRARWIDAICPSQDADDSEKIYEEWDCPQVQCITNFMAREPDELTLEESDVVNVFKKMPDGMYEGERIRDGQRGWFPSDNVVEIVNSHVRARNLRLRYRMMAVSGGSNG